MAVVFASTDTELMTDPFPVYAALRADHPVFYDEVDDLWVVSRYDDVLSVIRDPETYSSALGMGELMAMSNRSRRRRPPQFTLDMAGMRVLIATDPPDHTKLRRLVSRAFTPRTIGALEPRVRAVCEAMVTDLLEAAERGEADLVHQLASPFPVIVIAELLGIPADRRADFKRWSDGVVGSLSGAWDPDAAQQSGLEMFTFFADTVAERTARPADDLISLLALHGRDGDDALSTPEIVMFCILLLIAGNETTTNLIGNALHALWAHPGEAAKLAADLTLVPSAVEESLRFAGPVQGLFRGTTRAAELAGVSLPERARVMVLFGSANRDERIWPDAEQFLVDRNPTNHLGLGWGIHHCLGAQLARLEARVAAETLLRRVRTLQPAGPAEPVESFILRGYRSIPVAVEPA
jgi:cytochrome P450